MVAISGGKIADSLDAMIYRAADVGGAAAAGPGRRSRGGMEMSGL